MKSKNIQILAIESSCDETAAAVIGVENGQPIILSNIVSSQVDLHAKTGGVVPEVASRAHVENIVPVITEALLSQKSKVNGFDYAHHCPEQSRMGKSQNYNSKSKNFNYQKSIKALQNDIDYIAVTAGPGLIGSLLVGFNAAKTIAYALDKPIIPVNHIEGHIYSAFSREIRSSTGSDRPERQSNGRNPKSEILNKSENINDKNSEHVSNFEFGASSFPLIALTVSGGHTSLTLMKDHGKYKMLGETLDDAAGEAFDKVAKLLDLGYPGGPIVSKLASRFRDKSIVSKIVFPRPILNDGTFNFSFSGLKTSVLQKVIDLKKQYSENLSEDIKQEICTAFEDAVVDVLVTKTMRAAEKYKPIIIILAGGVAANNYLRETLELSTCDLQLATKFLMPPKIYCGDNAAMIGLAAYYHILRDDVSNWKNIKVDSNLELI